MTVAAQRGKCPGGRQRLQVAAIERGASRQILHAREGLLLASLDETVRAASRKRLDQPQTQPQRRLAIFPPLQRAVPDTHADIDRPYLHAMRPRIPDQLRRRVEAHRLAVEQRRRERRGLVTFEPCGIVTNKREAAA